MTDCLLGVLIQYYYQLALLGILKGTKYEFTPGIYDNPEGDSCQTSIYLQQLFWWFLIVLIVLTLLILGKVDNIWTFTYFV